ncbi:MAG: alpha/beta hydrolase, partial [Actinobacteria bacterium]|nr:alpha/beta hydrolase [Actinomycetota bacterium]
MMSSAQQVGRRGAGRPGRRRRFLIWIGAVVVVVVLAFFAGGGWYFSSQIRRDALLVEPPSVPDYRYEVLGVSAGGLTLALPENPPAELTDGELLGVVWEGGYGQAHAVLSRAEGSITREFASLTGVPEVGSLVALDSFAFPNDPAAVGIDWEVVTYASGLGDAEAWLVPGERSTWAVFVHGRGANPGEGLRALPAFSAAGFPALLITYRNDSGAPEVGGRLARFGATEWEDLEGAVRFVLARGADDVVLVGYSMGGAIVASFLLRSDLASEVEAAVLEAPALALGDMIDARAGDTTLPLIPVRVPIVLTAAAKQIASWRFGVNWGELDYVARAPEFTTPMLIIHGTADDTVPFAVSAEFASAASPGLVTLVPFDGAGHVRAWNVDRERYEAVLGQFLA